MDGFKTGSNYLSAIWHYFKYLSQHKWYVFVECVRRGQLWRGLTHDLSKFRPDEFFPYVRHFFGFKLDDTETRGYAVRNDQRKDRRFEMAWLRHQHRNDHHWQWWVRILADDMTVALPMSEGARIEMFCDWIGAGKAQGRPDIRIWYEEEKDSITLHPETRDWIEGQMKAFRPR